jgi:hypothetical protein
MVKWSNGDFEVEVTSIVSSFLWSLHLLRLHVPGYLSPMEWIVLRLQWKSRIGTTREADLYGTNAPFSNSNGVDVVHMQISGNQNQVDILIPAVPQGPETQYEHTLPQASQWCVTALKLGIMGDCSENIEDPTYNANGVDPNAIRVYGFEAFQFHSTSPYQNIIKISTSDGKTTHCTKNTTQ